MLTKVMEVVFQCLWRHSCQFKPQTLLCFHLHLCSPLSKRLFHQCARGRIDCILPTQL